ncbi:putative rho guanine nucleotide exchange factor vav3 [Operophtera brumata]|uniref:Putative rho guanine nucleotide exchange factor vav3 n=1 Tax=Operophtera brumata TaxID=104452 RepID=A0A0L7LKJ8_OPEBR|nr:putative rho guanine nucleotide exchange factor vav3 [Operophtera brumata]
MAAGGEDLWRECASWLTRCGLLRPDHKANWETSTIHDLAYTLRDGVLLCNLLNVLHPGCIDMKEVNQRPQMAQFLCMRNIKVFLRTCHEEFELRELDLFDPSMLFDLSNFHRVLCTLAKLSQCPKALVKNIKPFSAQRTLSEEDIYKDLQSVQSPAHNTAPDSPWVQFTIPSAACEERVEEIYEDLCYVKFTSAMPEVATLFGVAVPPRNSDSEYASYCARLHDEEIYHDLCAVKASARDPPLPAPNRATNTLATSSLSLEKRDYVIRELVDTECNYVDVLSKIIKHFLRPLELHEIHSGLLRQLKLATDACVPGSGAPRLADVFLVWRERLLLYGDYCSNLTHAQDTLKTLDVRDSTFSKQLQSAQIPPSIRKIGSGNPAERAKEAMVDVAQYINEVKRDSEILTLLAKVQVKAHEDQKLRTRYVFVFDKLMLLCKPVKKKAATGGLSGTMADGRRTSIWCGERKTPPSRSTQELKTANESGDNLEPPGCRSTNHKFVLHTFEKPATCHHCSKFLKGRIFQGYLCTVCNACAHKDCIALSGRCGGGLAPAPPPPPQHHQPDQVRGRDGSRDGYVAAGAARGRHLLTARAPAPRAHAHRHTLRALTQNGQHREAHASVPEAHRPGATLLPLRVALLPQYRRAGLLLREDQPLEASQLALRPGAKVLVLSKEGDSRGWWKGRTLDKVPTLLHRAARLQAARGVPAGAAPRRQGAGAQQGGRQSGLVEGKTSRQGTYITPPCCTTSGRSRRPSWRCAPAPRCWCSARRATVGAGGREELSTRYLHYSTVLHDFRPLEASQLALRPGAKVLVLSKEGDSRDWWKGRTLDKIT